MVYWYVYGVFVLLSLAVTLLHVFNTNINNAINYMLGLYIRCLPKRNNVKSIAMCNHR